MIRAHDDQAHDEPELDDIMAFILDAYENGRILSQSQLEVQFPKIRRRRDWLAKVEALFNAHAWMAGGRLESESRGSSVSEDGVEPDSTIERTSLPRRHGKFILIELLGSGGMADVFKGLDIDANRLVAVKRLRAALRGDEQAVARFTNESRLLMKLDHPGIVRVLETGVNDGVPFYTMEWVEGIALNRLPEEHTFAADKISEVMRDVSIAVEYAHQAGVLHRDLKPANILLTRDFAPKVSDFGLAKEVEGGIELTTDAQVIGTVKYMSPEQACGDIAHVDVRSDVFGIGAILYELLTGRAPFHGTDYGRLLEEARNSSPPAPRDLQPNIDARLEAVCLKCMARNPHHRYASAAEVASDLDRIVNGHRPQAPLNHIGRRVYRTIQRRPALATAFAAMLIGLLAMFAAGAIWVKERGRANAIEQRSLEAEREAVEATEEKIADQFAQAAWRSMQIGRWQYAIENASEAINRGHSDSHRLRLARARCLSAMMKRQEATTEFESLLADPTLPGELRASVLLWTGDHLLGFERERALAAIREAFDTKDLSPPDRFYAEGLLADDLAVSEAALKQCLALESYNVRAHQMLAVNYVLQRRLDDALFISRVGRIFSPEDPSFSLFESGVLALQGDTAAARILLQAEKEKFSPPFFELMESLLEVTALARDFTKNSSGQPRIKFIAKATLLCQRCAAFTNADHRSWDLPLSVAGAHMLDQTWTGFKIPDLDAQQISQFAFRLWLDPVDILRPLAESQNDGALFLALGRAIIDRRQGVADWLEAERAFERAVNTPSWFDVKAEAMVWLTLADAVLGCGNEDDAAKYQAKAAEHAKALCHPVSFPSVSDDMFVPLARSLIFFEDFELARDVIGHWQLQHPEDRRIFRERGRAEQGLGNHLRALHFFELARNDPEAVRLNDLDTMIEASKEAWRKKVAEFENEPDTPDANEP